MRALGSDAGGGSVNQGQPPARRQARLARQHVATARVLGAVAGAVAGVSTWPGRAAPARGPEDAGFSMARSVVPRIDLNLMTDFSCTLLRLLNDLRRNADGSNVEDAFNEFRKSLMI